MNKILKNCFFFICFTVITACNNSSHFASDSAKKSTPDFKINGGQVSEFLLPNGIRVVAISVPEAKQPQVSISVGIGSVHDPKNLPGLAHFVEHMLFLGSTEYPDSLETNNYIENNNGYRNAYTASENTNYQLTTSSEAFPEALKRTSRFFVSPLFTKTLIEKEKNAIQNEFILRFDNFKMYRAYSMLEGDRSLHTLFNIGNLESLAAATDDDARSFYNQYYSAQNMTVIVSGPQDLATLQSWIKENFSDVPSKQITLPVSTVKKDPKKNKIVKMNIPGTPPSLHLMIAIEKSEAPNVANAEKVLSSILSDESPGSLLSVLQDQGLAPSSPGALSGGIKEDKINLSIDLTESGVQNYDQIIAYTKGYLQFIARQIEPRYILDEQNGLAKAQMLTQDYSQLSVDEISRINDDFNKNEKSIKELLINDSTTTYAPSDYTKALTHLNNVHYAQAMLITGDETTEDVYPKLFSNVQFSDNHKIQIETVNNKQYIVDGYYKFVSSLEDFTLDTVKELTSENFSLPVANPYIPKNFQTKNKVELESTPSINALTSDIYYNSLLGSVLPETITSIYLFSANVNFNNSSELVKIILMKNWLLANIADDLYPFTVAGVEQAFNVLPLNSALRINIKSWNDTSVAVINDYIKLMQFNDNEVAFQKFKQVTLVSLQQNVRSAEEQIRYAAENVYTEWPTLQEHMSLVNQVTLKDLKEVYVRFFSKYHAQAVISGHYSSKDGDAIVQALTSHWPTAAISQKELDVIKQSAIGKTVSGQTEITVDVPDSASSTTVQFYQFGNSSQKELVMAALIGEWIGPEFYHELRTQQQLAYSLWAGFRPQGQYYGLWMYLESSNTGADEVNQRILAFINDWVTNKLPLKSQNDVLIFMNKRQKEIDENKAKVAHAIATSNLLHLNAPYTNLDEQLDINILELINFAKEKLMSNPSGIVIKIKSEEEKKSNAKVPKYIGMHPQ